MANICLWLTDSPDSSKMQQWLSHSSDIELIVCSMDEVTADIIKHAAILLVDEPELDNELMMILEARVVLSFSTTLVIGSTKATPYEPRLKSGAFSLNKANILAWLEEAGSRMTQPVYSVDTLVGSWRNELLAHSKADYFQREIVPQIGGSNWPSEMTESRESLLEFLDQTGDVSHFSLAKKVDLFVTLRAFECYEQLVEIYKSLHPVEQALDMFIEQYVFAANRLTKEVTQKLALIERLDAIVKPSAETLALKGRIYKDCWQITLADKDAASVYLNQAIDAYRLGSYLDIRDAYPAINLVTLLRIRGTSQDLFEMRKVINNIEYNLFVSTDALDMLKGMQFDVPGRRKADYWDIATVFEMSIINRRYDDAMALIDKLIGNCSEHWMLLSTQNNIQLLMNHSEPSFQQFMAPVFFTFKGKVEQL